MTDHEVNDGDEAYPRTGQRQVPISTWAVIALAAVLVAAFAVLVLSRDDAGSAQLVDGGNAESTALLPSAADEPLSPVATTSGLDTAAPVASVDSAGDVTASTIGGDPSQGGAWAYVVQPGDVPTALADDFSLRSWRDIFAVNGWVSLDEFPLPGTSILLPPSTLGTSGEPCDPTVVSSSLFPISTEVGRSLASGELWMGEFRCVEGGPNSNFANFWFDSDTPYMCVDTTADDPQPYPCADPGSNGDYECDRPPGEQAGNVVCYSPDGEETWARRVNGRWEYLTSGSAPEPCDWVADQAGRIELGC